MGGKIIGVVQVRMGSSRLPGKVMEEIESRPMAWHIVDRLRQAGSLSDVVIAVPDGPQDERIRAFADSCSIPYYAGSESDLIDRIYKTAVQFQSEAIVRITGDCPLVDPDVVDLLVKNYLNRKEKLDYVSNVRPRTFPHGLDTEVYPLTTLEKLWHQIQDPYYREWFPIYLWEHEHEYRTFNVRHSENLSHLRWTVDYNEDLAFVRKLYEQLYRPGRAFGMLDVLALLKAHPEFATINAAHARNERDSLAV